jgi:hypothetical protein
MNVFAPISTCCSVFRSHEEPKVATLVTAAPATASISATTAASERTTARRRVDFRSARLRLRRRRA